MEMDHNVSYAKRLKSRVSNFFLSNAKPSKSDDGNGAGRYSSSEDITIKPNDFFDDLQIFDTKKEITCLTVVDDKRIAVGLETGEVYVYDVHLGRGPSVLRYHRNKVIRILNVPNSSLKLIFSLGADKLIILWEVDTETMTKCFMVDHIPRTMLVMHQHGKDITLLCGDENKTLDILRYERLPDNEINVQKDPYPIERTENAGQVVDLVEMHNHVVCMASDFVDIYNKQWGADDSTNPSHLGLTMEGKEYYNFRYVCHDLAYVKTCAIKVADEKVALGTSLVQKNQSIGGVFIMDLSNNNHQKPYEISLDSPVKSLRMLNEAWICAMCERTIQLISITDTGSMKLNWKQEVGYASHPLHSITAADARFLVVLPENSIVAHVLDYSQFPVDKKSVNNFNGKLINANTIIAHDNQIQAVSCLKDGALVTRGGDSLIIVWRNRDKETLRLMMSVRESSRHSSVG